VISADAKISRDQTTLCFRSFLEQLAPIHGFAKIATEAITKITGKMVRQ
jgi:hypothetical protein